MMFFDRRQKAGAQASRSSGFVASFGIIGFWDLFPLPGGHYYLPCAVYLFFVLSPGSGLEYRGGFLASVDTIKSVYYIFGKGGR